jgi:hypothetical protein
LLWWQIRLRLRRPLSSVILSSQAKDLVPHVALGLCDLVSGHRKDAPDDPLPPVAITIGDCQ